jgi:hypothetical protein
LQKRKYIYKLWQQWSVSCKKVHAHWKNFDRLGPTDFPGVLDLDCLSQIIYRKQSSSDIFLDYYFMIQQMILKQVRVKKWRVPVSWISDRLSSFAILIFHACSQISAQVFSIFLSSFIFYVFILREYLYKIMFVICSSKSTKNFDSKRLIFSYLV